MIDTKKKIIEEQSFLWGDEVANTYHKDATNDMNRHWDDIIFPFLKEFKIDYSETIDFACGRGRNTDKLLSYAQNVTLIDVNSDNLSFCKNKYNELSNIHFYHCNGYNLQGLETEKFSFFYTFDSMVHFDLELMLSYLPEIFRILRPGGTAFFHHSNFTKSPGQDFRANPHWRNFMSADIFKHIAVNSNLNVKSQKVIDWGGVEEIDCLTLCTK